MLKKELRKLGGQRKRGQRGAIMIIALVVLVFGSMAVSGLIEYCNANTKSQARAQERLVSRYAADAGMVYFLDDFRGRLATPYGSGDVGTDLWPVGTTINGKTPVVQITNYTGDTTAKRYIVESSAGGKTVKATVDWLNVGSTPTVTLVEWEVK